MRDRYGALVGAWLLCLVAPVSADESGGLGSHRELTTIITQIRSGMIFVEPFEGLRPRTISPAKADRLGLHDTKPGDDLTVVVDEGNVLVDAHKTGVPVAGHRFVTGYLDYADVSWAEVQLSTPEGLERFDVDPLAGHRLSLTREGAPLLIELDEDNMVIDIHRSVD